MTWQRFTNPRMSARSTRLWLSLQKNGRIHLSRGLVEALGSDGVVLYFDPDGPRLGLEAASSTDPDFVPIKKSSTQQSWGIAAQTFVNRFGIKVRRARQYLVEREKTLWVADLRGADLTWEPQGRQ